MSTISHDDLLDVYTSGVYHSFHRQIGSRTSATRVSISRPLSDFACYLHTSPIRGTAHWLNPSFLREPTHTSATRSGEIQMGRHNMSRKLFTVAAILVL